MSGGSYNYLCYAQDLEDVIGKRHDLQDMIDRLAAMDETQFPGAQAAAKESERLLVRLRMWETHVETVLEVLKPVWKAVEWKDSADWGNNSIVEALDEMLNPKEKSDA